MNEIQKITEIITMAVCNILNMIVDIVNLPVINMIYTTMLWYIPLWLLYLAMDISDTRRDLRIARKSVKNNRYRSIYTKEHCEKILKHANTKADANAFRKLAIVEVVIMLIYFYSTGKIGPVS